MKNKFKDIFINTSSSVDEKSIYDTEIERAKLLRFFIRIFIEIVKFIAMIILIILAVIGIISIVYPEPRKDLYDILTQAYITYLTFIK